MNDPSRDSCIHIKTSGVTLEGKQNPVEYSGARELTGIYVHDPANDPIHDTIIRNVKLSGWRDAILFDNTDLGVISGSDISGKYSGIQLTASKNIIIQANAVHDNTIGIYLLGASENTIGGWPRCSFFWQLQAPRCTLKNTITGNQQVGIYIIGNSNKVIGNTITENKGLNIGSPGGVVISGDSGTHSTNNIIRLNNISANYMGVRLEIDTMGNSVTANRIENNEKYGIFLSTADNNLISTNVIRNNTEAELSLMQTTSGNTISNNWIRKSTTGKFVDIPFFAGGSSNEFSSATLGPGPNIAGGRYVGGNYWEWADTLCNAVDLDNDGFYDSPFYPENNSFCTMKKGLNVDEKPLVLRKESRVCYPVNMQICEYPKNRLFELAWPHADLVKILEKPRIVMPLSCIMKMSPCSLNSAFVC
jgi:parallel beta-helix repeat protein